MFYFSIQKVQKQRRQYVMKGILKNENELEFYQLEKLFFRACDQTFLRCKLIGLMNSHIVF